MKLLRLHISSLFGLLLFLYSANAVHAQSRASNPNALPEIGVVASDALTIEREKILGDNIMRQLRGQAPLIQDPVLSEYIQDLGNRMVAQADNAKFPFTFFLIRNPVINAFAFYGGHIGIHSGLITQADNESELASVVAHEIAHVTQRHLARSQQEAQRSTPLQIASMLGGILLAMADPEAGMAALSLGMAGNQQNQINYTRRMEQEADNIGIGILARAGFDPQGAPRFFGKLAAKAKSPTANQLAFLRTHPIPEERIAETRARAERYGRVERAPDLDFQLAKARLAARYSGDPARQTVHFIEQSNNTTGEIHLAAKYGLAIAYFELEEYEQAKAILVNLLQNDPENLFYLDALTDVHLRLQAPKLAISLLKPHWQLRPQNKVLALNYANALIANQAYPGAIQVLRDLLLIDNQDYLAYSLLVDAYAQSQQRKEMHKANAERFALIAAYPLAIDELNYAYNRVQTDFLEKQRIKARIEQLRNAQAELQN